MHGVFIPVNAQRVARRLGLPEGIGDDGHTRGHSGYFANASHTAGARVVEILHSRAKDGRAGDHRSQHSARFDVNSKNCFAVGFFRGIETLQRFADDFERLGIFQRRLGWRGHLRRSFR